VPVNRQLRLPEGFAIDFIRLNPDRRLFSGPVGSLSSYASFGVDVLSVADGTVVRTHDGEPEQTPPNSPPPFDPETAPGNWMVADLGGGHFVLYAHLQPRTHTATVGDRVRRGAAIWGADHPNDRVSYRDLPPDADVIAYCRGPCCVHAGPGGPHAGPARAAGRATGRWPPRMGARRAVRDERAELNEHPDP